MYKRMIHKIVGVHKNQNMLSIKKKASNGFDVPTAACEKKLIVNAKAKKHSIISIPKPILNFFLDILIVSIRITIPHIFRIITSLN